MSTGTGPADDLAEKHASSSEDDLLVRALRVLEALAGMQQPASMAAVIDRVGMNQTQVYRALRALQGSGYIDHIGRQGYRVGTRGLSLGTLLSSRPELRELARPVLVRLASATSTTVSFHLRNGRYRVLILAAVPPRRPADGPRPEPEVVLGERSTLTRGCSGSAILAHLPEPQVRAIVATLAAEESAVVTTRLERARRDGYALSFADNHAGLNGISVALLDPEGGEPLGALSLSGEADRFDEAALIGLADELRAAAAHLAPRLAVTLGPRASASRAALDTSP